MPYYLQINAADIVVAATEAHSPIDGPDLIEVDGLFADLIGQRYDREASAPGAPVFVPVVAPMEPTRLTKRAFQNRFPKSADGISTKYDLMTLFLGDDGYAASLGVSGAQLYGLRALIITGRNRLDASPHVDLAVSDAADFTGLLVNEAIPDAFQLTPAERDAILALPLAPAEQFKG